MINRRTLLTSSVATAGVALTAPRFAAANAQESELQVQNATFVDSPDQFGSADSMASPTPVTDARGYILGDPDAPNTLQIYSDYRCPHCRVFYADIEASVIADFVETGKMNLELMDFTVVGVPALDQLHIDVLESVQAAEAAACAAEQDAYLEYRDWLFQGPPQLNAGDFADSALIKAALDMGLDLEMFVTSLASGKFEPGIIAMVHAGIASGVQGTPTMTMNNGEPFYMPSEGYDALKAILEDQLQ